MRAKAPDLSPGFGAQAPQRMSEEVRARKDASGGARHRRFRTRRFSAQNSKARPFQKDREGFFLLKRLSNRCSALLLPLSLDSSSDSSPEACEADGRDRSHAVEAVGVSGQSADPKVRRRSVRHKTFGRFDSPHRSANSLWLVCVLPSSTLKTDRSLAQCDLESGRDFDKHLFTSRYEAQNSMFGWRDMRQVPKQTSA
eukprot:scaffold1005_cov403-Pinguiococcus_pyrenoidosus.AAC.1